MIYYIQGTNYHSLRHCNDDDFKGFEAKSWKQAIGKQKSFLCFDKLNEAKLNTLEFG